MKPRARVGFYFASIIFLVLLCIISAIVLHPSFLSMIVVIVIAAITTFFASSSKFAKEVKWIRRWKRVTKRPMQKYPQTFEQRINTRRELYPELHQRGEAFIAIEDKWTVACMRHASPRNIAELEAEKNYCLMHFLLLWNVLRDAKSLPLNLGTGHPWKGNEHKEFIASIRSIAEFNEFSLAKARA